MIVFQYLTQQCAEMHVDDEGIDEIIRMLTKLRRSGKNDHDHWMVEEWGGRELGSEAQNLDPKAEVIFKLDVRYWGRDGS